MMFCDVSSCSKLRCWRYSTAAGVGCDRHSAISQKKMDKFVVLDAGRDASARPSIPNQQLAGETRRG